MFILKIKNFSHILLNSWKTLFNFKILISIFGIVIFLLSLSVSTLLAINSAVIGGESNFVAKNQIASYKYSMNEDSPPQIYNLFCADSLEITIENDELGTTTGFNPYFSFGDNGCFETIAVADFEIHYVYDYATGRIRRVRPRLNIKSFPNQGGIMPKLENNWIVPDVINSLEKSSYKNEQKNGNYVTGFEESESPRDFVPESGVTFLNYPKLNMNSQAVKNSLFGRLIQRYKTNLDERYLKLANNLYWGNFSYLVHYLENEIADTINNYLNNNSIYESKTLNDSTLASYYYEFLNTPDVTGRFDYITSPLTLPGVADISENHSWNILLRDSYKNTFTFWKETLVQFKIWSAAGIIDLHLPENYTELSSTKTLWNEQIFNSDNVLNKFATGEFSRILSEILLHINIRINDLEKAFGGIDIKDFDVMEWDDNDPIYIDLKRITLNTIALINEFKKWINEQSDTIQQRMQASNAFDQWETEIANWNDYWSAKDLVPEFNPELLPNGLSRNDIAEMLTKETSLLTENLIVINQIKIQTQLLIDHVTFAKIYSDQTVTTGLIARLNSLIEMIKTHTNIPLNLFNEIPLAELAAYDATEIKRFINETKNRINEIEHAKAWIINLVKYFTSEQNIFRPLNDNPDLNIALQYFNKEAVPKRAFQIGGYTSFDLKLKTTSIDSDLASVTTEITINQFLDSVGYLELFAQQKNQLYSYEKVFNGNDNNQLDVSAESNSGEIALIEQALNDVLKILFWDPDKSSFSSPELHKKYIENKKSLKSLNWQRAYFYSPDFRLLWSVMETIELLETSWLAIDSTGNNNNPVVNNIIGSHTYEDLDVAPPTQIMIPVGTTNSDGTLSQSDVNTEYSALKTALKELINPLLVDLKAGALTGNLQINDHERTRWSEIKELFSAQYLELMAVNDGVDKINKLETSELPASEVLRSIFFFYDIYSNYEDNFWRNLKLNKNELYGNFDYFKWSETYRLIYSNTNLVPDDYEWNALRMKQVMNNQRLHMKMIISIKDSSEFCEDSSVSKFCEENPNLKEPGNLIDEMRGVDYRLNKVKPKGFVPEFYRIKKITGGHNAILNRLIAKQVSAPATSRPLTSSLHRSVNWDDDSVAMLNGDIELFSMFNVDVDNVYWQSTYDQLLKFVKKLLIEYLNDNNLPGKVVLKNEYQLIKNNEKIIASGRFFHVISNQVTEWPDNFRGEFIFQEKKLLKQSLKKSAAWLHRPNIYFPTQGELTKIYTSGSYNNSDYLERLNVINKAAAWMNGLNSRSVWSALVYQLGTDQKNLIIRQDADTEYYMESGDRIKTWNELIVHPRSVVSENLKLNQELVIIKIEDLIITGIGTTEDFVYSQLVAGVPIDELNRVIYVSGRVYRELQDQLWILPENTSYIAEIIYYLEAATTQTDIAARTAHFLNEIGESLHGDDYNLFHHRLLDRSGAPSSANAYHQQATEMSFDGNDMSSTATNKKFYILTKTSLYFYSLLLTVLLIIALVWILFLLVSKQIDETQSSIGTLMALGLPRKALFLNYLPLLFPGGFAAFGGWIGSYFVAGFIFSTLREKIAYNFLQNHDFNFLFLLYSFFILLAMYWLIIGIIHWYLMSGAKVLNLINQTRDQAQYFWVLKLERLIIGAMFNRLSPGAQITLLYGFDFTKKILILITTVAFFIFIIFGNFIILTTGGETLARTNANINYHQKFNLYSPNQNNPLTRLNPIYHQGFQKIKSGDYDPNYPIQDSGIEYYREYFDGESGPVLITIDSYKQLLEYLRPFYNVGLSVNYIAKVFGKIANDDSEGEENQVKILPLCQMIVSIARLDKDIDSEEKCIAFLGSQAPPIDYSQYDLTNEELREVVFRFMINFAGLGVNIADISKSNPFPYDELTTEFNGYITDKNSKKNEQTNVKVIGIGSESRAFNLGPKRTELIKDLENGITIDEDGNSVVNVIINRQLQHLHDYQIGETFTMSRKDVRTTIYEKTIKREDWFYLPIGTDRSDPDLTIDDYMLFDGDDSIFGKGTPNFYRGTELVAWLPDVTIDPDTGVMIETMTDDHDVTTQRVFNFVQKNKDVLVDAGAPEYKQVYDSERIFLRFNDELIRPFVADSSRNYTFKFTGARYSWWAQRLRKGHIVEVKTRVALADENGNPYKFKVIGYLDTYSQVELLVGQETANILLDWPTQKDELGNYRYFNTKINYSADFANAIYSWGVINKSGWTDFDTMTTGRSRSYSITSIELVKYTQAVIADEINFILRIGLITLLFSIFSVFALLLFVFYNTLETLKQKMIYLKALGYSARFFITQNLILFLIPTLIAITIATALMQIFINVAPIAILKSTGFFIFFTGTGVFYLLIALFILAVFFGILIYTYYQYKKINIASSISVRE